MSIEIPPEHQPDDPSLYEDWQHGLVYNYPNQGYAIANGPVGFESTAYEDGCDVKRPEPNGLNDFWTMEDAGEPR